MSELTRTELTGEAMSRCGEDWDNLSNVFRLLWGLKSDCPPLGIRMMSHLFWRSLPDQTKVSLYKAWTEGK